MIKYMMVKISIRSRIEMLSKAEATWLLSIHNLK